MVDLTDRVIALKIDDKVVQSTRKEWSRLRHSWAEPKGQGSRANPEKMRTNDPETYFDMALHLLSSRPLRWKISSAPQDPEEEVRLNGIAERTLTNVLSFNDYRRAKISKGRAHRDLTDSACEQGKMAVFRERIDGPRGTEFHIDIADPATTWDRTDDEGLAEFLREWETDVAWVKGKIRNNETWFLPEKVTLPDKGSVIIWDFWERIPDGSYKNTVNVGIRSAGIGSQTNWYTVHEKYTPDIPWIVQYCNGDPKGVNQVEKGRGILEINRRLYDDKHPKTPKPHC